MVFFVKNVILIFLTVLNIGSSLLFTETINKYAIYQVTAFNALERDVLLKAHSRVDEIIFINGVSNEASLPMDILVEEVTTPLFESLMKANDIEYVKMPEKKLIAKRADLYGHLYQHGNATIERKITKEFLYYDTIRQWVKYKIKKNSILEEISIGQTYEKRDIFVIKISTGIKNKAVFLMGGEEGRDWASSVMLLNLIDYILDKKTNLEILLKQYDFYILPIFNPDGYMYSMVKDRLWAKNSRVYFPKSACPQNASSVGISVDRNWFLSSKHYVLNLECEPVFAGLRALSEEETIATSKFLNQIAPKLMAFINIRGFENLVTIPYGYDKKHCNNYDVLNDMVSAVHDQVVKNHKTTFYYGLTAKYVYNYSGNVADWVKQQLNIPIVYTFYMKEGSYILPSIADIPPLTARLSTMLRHILLLAKTFYGPLFNGQCRQTNNFIKILIITNMPYVIMSSHYRNFV